MCSNMEVDAPYRVKAVQIQYTRLGKKNPLPGITGYPGFLPQKENSQCWQCLLENS